MGTGRQGVSDLSSETINLGKITTGKLSLFNVKASSTQPVILSYKYSGGRLPPGLSVAVDGGIQGKCGTNVYDTDNGLTTYDSGNTTIDRSYHFSVTATGQFGNVSSEQSFRITVVKTTNDELANVYGQIFVEKTQRDAFTNFITNNKIFPNDDLFRPYDLNFDTKFPKFLFLAGLHLKFLDKIQSFLKENTYDFTLTFGDFKVAQAKDNVGNTIYDVIYAELKDPNEGANDYIDYTYNKKLPNILSNLRADTMELLSDLSILIPGTYTNNLYSNDVKNMQEEITNQIQVENFNYLPRWMQSYQNNNQVLGFKLVLPIKFVKPGQGNKVLYRIKNENSYDIKTLTATFDRWIFDNNLGTKFDFDKIVTHLGDGTTTIFSCPYKITKPQQAVVTLDGVVTSDYVVSFNVLSDNAHITADSNILTADIDNPGTTNIIFGTAPLSSAVIVVRLKETTFGKKVVTTFDVSSTATTFDDNGTRFIGEEVTFDKKNPSQAQILFTKKSVLDNITTVSKQRKLVRSL